MKSEVNIELYRGLKPRFIKGLRRLIISSSMGKTYKNNNTNNWEKIQWNRLKFVGAF